MDYANIQSFELALRRAIERSDLAGAEALIETRLRETSDPLLHAAFDRSPELLRISGWDSIAAQMERARRGLAEEDFGREWAAVLFGLINRNDVEGLPITVKFSFDAEPGQAMSWRPSYMTDEQFEAWQADNKERVFLPRGGRYPSYATEGRPCLQGLEDLRSVHDRRPGSPIDQAEQERIWAAQSLAAAIVLLRFHQLIERYVEDPGLPRALAVFAYVETAEWPMETGTVDYGTQATRRLAPRKVNHGPSTTAAVDAGIRAEREARRLAETRRAITAVRELNLALALWPWWRNRSERRRLEMLTESYVDPVLLAVERAGLCGSSLTVEGLCECYARLLLGDDAALALDASEPIERTPMQRLAIAHARKFGGAKVNEALAHVPPPPDWLVRHCDQPL